MRFIPLLLVLSILLVSCDYFKQEDPRIPIARVNDTYLYEDDISDLVAQTTTPEDSILVVSNYINRWATQQLLIDQARINLGDEEQQAYDKLVEQYKIDLYTEAYKSSIVSARLDSTITQQELERFYEANKENFKLNNRLVKVRYIHVNENFANLSRVKEQFKNFTKEDQKALTELSIHFQSFNLNDSTWVKKESLIGNIPVIQSSEKQVLKKSNFTQLQDSLGVYLVHIVDLLDRNDIAPLSYVAPTIEQIILNRRKLELVKELEKDITKDALKNKQFETYSPN
ncbi:MAG: peptidyl-prolyl cis-trans isomerase [Flavobacteriaceae bacterium]|nr:peptidyl-prolyl cis-trans isomerase [Flavobacteriaceae bacterium]